jgi:hypothetical protein
MIRFARLAPHALLRGRGYDEQPRRKTAEQDALRRRKHWMHRLDPRPVLNSFVVPGSHSNH